jgi:signal transduction histidine kinase
MQQVTKEKNIDLSLEAKSEITEGSVVPIFAFDEGEALVYCNGAAKKLCGVRDLSELQQTGFPLARRNMSDKGGSLVGLCRVSHFSEELIIEVKTAKFIPCLINVGACADPQSGQQIKYISLFDITEIRSNRAQLEEVNQDLQIANQTKRDFLAHMSHELRTPLNAVIGFSDIMVRELFGPLGADKYLDYTRDIHESGKYLLSLVNDLLDMSKLESGKFELYEEVFDVGELLEACLRMLKIQIDESEIDVHLRLDDNLPALRGDERILRQTVTNLLSNAAKFTSSGGQIILSATVNPATGIEISVSDTGCGIPDTHLEKVMTPFGQSYDIERRGERGTGLGLPLAKSFVELHRGKLTLQSEVDVGTTVKISLPSDRLVDR